MRYLITSWRSYAVASDNQLEVRCCDGWPPSKKYFFRTRKVVFSAASTLSLTLSLKFFVGIRDDRRHFCIIYICPPYSGLATSHACLRVGYPKGSCFRGYTSRG